MNYDRIGQKLINSVYSVSSSSSAGLPPISSLYFMCGVCCASSCIKK
jgi:hypothetical protein